MRHDLHFVEDLTTRDESAIGRMLSLANIRPDPGQPRHGMGDLSELVASIKDKGVLEPILVRPLGELGEEAYVIISGERRYRAALQAGLSDIPAIEMLVDDEEALEIALVENLQRQDLTAFEEAEGYQVLQSKHSYTHDRIATAVGKSRTTVTESLSLLQIPESVRQSVQALGIQSKSILLEVLKLEDPEKMQRLLERIAAQGLGREAVRKEVKKHSRTKPGGRAKPYQFQFRAPDKSYRLSLSFRQSSVDPHDMIRALEAALEEVRGQLQTSERSLFEE